MKRVTEWDRKAAIRKRHIKERLRPGCSVWDVVRLIGSSEVTARKDLREMGWMAPKGEKA